MKDIVWPIKWLSKEEAEKMFPPKKADCLTCISFTSFQEDYCDGMEPDDQGFCHESNSPYWYNEGAGTGIICDFYKPTKNLQNHD